MGAACRPVPQVSQPAGSPISQSAGRAAVGRVRSGNDRRVGKPNATRISHPFGLAFTREIAVTARFASLGLRALEYWTPRPALRRPAIPPLLGERAGVRAGVISSRRDSIPPLSNGSKTRVSSINSTPFIKIARWNPAALDLQPALGERPPLMNDGQPNRSPSCHGRAVSRSQTGAPSTMGACRVLLHVSRFSLPTYCAADQVASGS